MHGRGGYREREGGQREKFREKTKKDVTAEREIFQKLTETSPPPPPQKRKEKRWNSKVNCKVRGGRWTRITEKEINIYITVDVVNNGDIGGDGDK